jgi:stalled ribosome rescue protein Dom34
MIKKTKIGIWMDHSVANLMDYPASPILTRTIACNFTSKAKEEALTRGESTMHTKEQSEQADYYKVLANIIRKYDEVLLFGPTEAKTEFYNTLKDNYLFSKIKFEIRPTDKMTENQQHAFVSSYFKVDVN